MLQTGEILRIDPNTGALTLAWDLRVQASVNATSVYDIATSLVRHFSGAIFPGNIVYGDLALLRRGNQLDLFVSGVSIVTPFVMRVRILPNQPLEARVLVASSAIFGNENGVVNVPRGVAVNAAGTVLTSLPIAGPPTCMVCQGKDVGVTLSADFLPGSGPAPSIILSQQDLHSRGMATDAAGNFYLATGSVGTSLCGVSGSGALVFIPRALNTVSCALVGATLTASQDVTVNPASNRAYMTVSVNSVLGSNGILAFPIIQPPPVSADLAVTVTDTPDPVSLGNHLTYRVTTTNHGPARAVGVTLTDRLPAGASFVSASPDCTHASGTVTCALGALASGASTTRQIVVTPMAPGVLTNTIVVTSTTSDPSAANNTAAVTTTVTAGADLAVILTDAPDPVNAGAELTYTVTLRNLGPSVANGVEIVDTLPAGVTNVRCTGCERCTVDGNVLTCPQEPLEH